MILKICDAEIERVTEIQFLVIIDYNQLGDNIKYIKEKTAKTIAIFYRSIINYKALHIAYSSLMLIYCISLCGIMGFHA